jgi:hypothetical protein
VATADQADRVARRRGVESPRGRGSPVDQLQIVIVIAQANPADVKSALGIVVRTAEAQAALGQVELGYSLLVLGRGNVTLQTCLVSAAGAAPGTDARQFLLAALSRLVKQAVEHRHVFLLRPDGTGVTGRFTRAFRFAFRGRL